MRRVSVPGWPPCPSGRGGGSACGVLRTDPFPALRYAAVTALVALVGVNVLTLSLTPPRDAVSRMTNEAPALIVQREDQPVRRAHQ
jgi:hypothetical protein